MIASVAATFLTVALSAEPGVSETDAEAVRTKAYELAAILDDPDEIVRMKAAAGLADLGPAAMPVVLPIAAALEDPHASVRLSAVEALRRIGPKAACVAGTEMRARLQDESWVVASAATKTLEEWRSDKTFWCSSIGPGDALALIRESRGDLDLARELVNGRCYPLRDLTSQAAVSAVLGSTRSNREEVAQFWRRRESTSQYVLTLRTAAKKDLFFRAFHLPRIRWRFLLSKVRPNDYLSLQAFPAIYSLADPIERDAMRRLVHEAIDRVIVLNPSVGESPKVVNSAFVEQIIEPLLNSPDKALRNAAWELVQEMRRESDPAFRISEILSSIHEERSAAARIGVIEALTEENPRALEWLETHATKDVSRAVRSAAIGMLNRWKDPQAATVLLMVVSNDDETPQLRWEAIAAFRKLAAREQWPVDRKLDDIERQFVRVAVVEEVRRMTQSEMTLSDLIQKARRQEILRLATEGVGKTAP